MTTPATSEPALVDAADPGTWPGGTDPRNRCTVCGTPDRHRLTRVNADPPADLLCHNDFLTAMATLGPPDVTAFCTRCASRAVVAIGTLATAHTEHQPLTRACRSCLTSAITDLAAAHRANSQE